VIAWRPVLARPPPDQQRSFRTLPGFAGVRRSTGRQSRNRQYLRSWILVVSGRIFLALVSSNVYGMEKGQ
jgi:hypothetical protein